MPRHSVIPETDETLKVPIIDDDDFLRKVLTHMFSAGCHTVSSISNGGETVELIRRHPFDLVITDLLMDGADGMEVLRPARQNQPEAVARITTGLASLQTALEVVREGAQDNIRKPFRWD